MQNGGFEYKMVNKNYWQLSDKIFSWDKQKSPVEETFKKGHIDPKFGRISFFPFVVAFANYPVSGGDNVAFVFVSRRITLGRRNMLQKLPSPRDFTKSMP